MSSQLTYSGFSARQALSLQQVRQTLSLLQLVQKNPYIPELPYIGDAQKNHAKQAAFIVAPQLEVLYGGAAGGGKSSALLMAALMYVGEPKYAALLVRRTYADLSLPGALMDRAKQWLSNTSAHWDALRKTWTFPSGATLTFGNLENEGDKYRYQSTEFQYIGFDELTQFSESTYTYLFSRLRRLEGSDVPLRMRAGSNPGGIGHDWVKQRFLVERAPDRLFVRATLDDNPHLDRETYERTLSELDPVTYAQLRRGDWTARQAGGWFHAEDFEIVEVAPTGMRECRFWDLAASEAKAGRDPDWTAGVRLGKAKDGSWYVVDVRRFREAPGRTEKIIAHTASEDGRRVEIGMEEEPGSSGKIAIDHYRRRVLSGYSFWGVKATGDKADRARPVAAAAAGGLVKLVRGEWNRPFLAEVEAFPQEGIHDDQVDGMSGAFARLTRGMALEYMREAAAAVQRRP